METPTVTVAKPWNRAQVPGMDQAEGRPEGGVYATKLCPRLCLGYQLLSDCVCM